jgi:hypothetical protein
MIGLGWFRLAADRSRRGWLPMVEATLAAVHGRDHPAIAVLSP